VLRELALLSHANAAPRFRVLLAGKLRTALFELSPGPNGPTACDVRWRS
jgi:hypothetical protein